MCRVTAVPSRSPQGQLAACSDGAGQGPCWGKRCSAPENSGSHPLPGITAPAPSALRSGAASRHLQLVLEDGPGAAPGSANGHCSIHGCPMAAIASCGLFWWFWVGFFFYMPDFCEPPCKYRTRRL